MTEYRRRLLLDNHFSQTCKVCPMSGKRAPEVVAGRIDDLMEAVWQESESNVIHLASLYNLTPSDLSRLRADMLHAKGVQTSLIQLKCSYWKALPWLLIGVAHHGEDCARQIAKECLRKFDADPRPPPVQHRVTWDLLSPEAGFRSELQKFADGASRWSLNTEFQEQVAAFMFVPVVETTIEEKHARVSHQAKRHAIGPTRVSLSNRLPLFERLVLRDPNFITQFLDQFEAARSMRAIPHLLNFDTHPLLLSREMEGGGQTTDLVPLISSIFYHRDLENSYRSLKAFRRKDDASRGKRAREEANMSSTFTHAGQDTIIRLAIADHFRQIYEPNTFYGIPAAAEASSQSIEEYFESTGTAAAKRAREKRARSEGLLAIEDVGSECRDLMFQVRRRRESFPFLPQVPKARALACFFCSWVGGACGLGSSPWKCALRFLCIHVLVACLCQVSLANIGRKKTVRLAPGAGRRINRKDLTILVFSNDMLRGNAEMPAVRSGSSAASVHVLEDFGRPDVLHEHFIKWSHTEKSLVYTFPFIPQDVAPEPALSDFV